LDYGCGPGKVAQYLEYKGVRNSFKIDGVDISEKAIKLARKHYDSVFLSDGNFYPENKKYDIVLLNSIIEHLEPDRLDCLFRKIEASTNAIFIVVPNFYSAGRILRGRKSELEKERTDLGHVNFMTQSKISGLLRRFGYNSIQYSFLHIFRDINLANYERFNRFKLLYSLYSVFSVFPFYYCRDSFWIFAKK
jgi:SAM-dependent methyltransferase